MSNSPKENVEKMLRILTAWKTMAAAKKFANTTVEEFEILVNKSLAPRRRLEEIENEVTQLIAMRDAQDLAGLSKIEKIVSGVVSDDEFGSDSALYEAFGYIRKSDRKSGLTRKKKEPANPNP